MNQIFIENIRAQAQVGIYPEELTVSQPVVLSLRLGINGRAARSDRIEDTIDYAVLVARVRSALSKRRFGLLEHLAEHLTGLIFDEFRPLSVELSVHKPDVLPEVGRVGVMIARELEQHISTARAPRYETA